MPELPELVVMQEILTEKILGRTIVDVKAIHPGILKTVEPALESLIGKRFRSVARRGKHLIFTLDDDLQFVVHLMLAGRLILCQSGTKATKASGCLISFEDGEDLRIIENASIHRVCVYVVRDPLDIERIASAGVEPLSDAFTIEYLTQHVLARKRQLKKLLTDQTVIVGIGTAYADEILFDARLSPIRYGTTMDEAGIRRLYDSIRSVLRRATEETRAGAGGATLTPHERPFARVFKKSETPCPECGTKIAEIRYAQTKTYYCPSCQSQGKSVRDRRSWLHR
jgi:formamidopyrimidine-DNA glycosylase